MAKLYRFLTGPDDTTFCHKITKALSEGWTLYGDPTYIANPASGELSCGQAVIKDIDANYDPKRKLRDQ